MKVAIQGISGSFHAQATRKLCADQPYELLPCVHFQGVFDAVATGQADRGIVAIENSIHGSINAVYRLLERHSVWIGGETRLAIDQYLIAHQAFDLEAVQKLPEPHVLSQAPALAQVELWLDANLPQAIREETQDTAKSVQIVTEAKDDSLFAVAGTEAAAQYHGHIVAGPINDDPHNYTRFVLLYPKEIASTNANRTSIILKTDHAPGALLRALQVFADHSINLSKLDSHPIASDKRHYAFYIDYDEGLYEESSQASLKKLAALGYHAKILGSYRV